MLQVPLVTQGDQVPWSTFGEIVMAAALLKFGQWPHPPPEDVPEEENITVDEANEA